MGDTGVIQLAKALLSNTRLKSLTLANNGIGDKGAVSLGQWCLPENTNLTSLDLSWNNIKTHGAQALAQGLALNSGLVSATIPPIIFYYFVAFDCYSRPAPFLPDRPAT